MERYFTVLQPKLNNPIEGNPFNTAFYAKRAEVRDRIEKILAGGSKDKNNNIKDDSAEESKKEFESPLERLRREILRDAKIEDINSSKARTNPITRSIYYNNNNFKSNITIDDENKLNKNSENGTNNRSEDENTIVFYPPKEQQMKSQLNPKYLISVCDSSELDSSLYESIYRTSRKQSLNAARELAAAAVSGYNSFGL